MYFLGANESSPTSITSSTTVSPPSEYFLWEVEASGSSQWKFRNVGSGNYLSVTASGSTVKLNMSVSGAVFSYLSSTTTTGRLYYTYKSKKYYVRYYGGYSTSTGTSYSLLSFNRFSYSEEEKLTHTTPANIEWGYDSYKGEHETGEKSTYFTFIITITNLYSGIDVPAQTVTAASSSTITNYSDLRERGLSVTLADIIVDYKARKVGNVQPDSEHPDRWIIKAKTTFTSLSDEEWKGTPETNWSDSVRINWTYGPQSGSMTVALTVLRLFDEFVDEMTMEVVPGSYEFAATAATADADYGWKQEFEIVRRIRSGAIVHYADGSICLDKTSVTTMPSDIWAFETKEEGGVVYEYPLCLGCSTQVFFEDGTHFAETGEHGNSSFFVQPNANNTSGSIYSDVMHVRHRYDYYVDGVGSAAYPKVYPSFPEYPGGLGEPVEPSVLDYADGADDPDYISAYSEYETKKAAYDAAIAAWETEMTAYYEEIDKDEYYVHAYVDISQLNAASMKFDRYVSQRGASGRDLKLVGLKNIQGVHEAFSTLYCIPGGETKLKLRGTSFFGWMRWFDYGKDNSVTTLYGNPIWETKPTASASGKTYEFVNIGNEFSTYSRGQYYAYGHSPFPSATASYSIPIINTPAQSVLDSYEASGKPLLPMDVACDVSNYVDYNFSTSGGAQLITGPTLSYRQVFQLRHADEMVARMEAVKVSDRTYTGTATDKDPHWDDESKDAYLEEHVCILPAGRYVTLPTDYKYQYYSHESELGYIYTVTGTGSGGGVTKTYKRVGQDGEEVAQWYVDGVKANLSSGESADDATYKGYVNSTTSFLVLNPHLMPSGTIVDTVVYTLATKSYNIARYVLIYQPISVVGPIAESGTPATAIVTDYDIENRYEVLARCTFDPPISVDDTRTKLDGNGNTYTAPGTSAIRTYNVPLSWEECSYGFAYSRADITSSVSRRNTASADVQYGEKNQRSGGGTGAGFFPYWGEYMFINKLVPDLNGGYIINTIEQKGGAANGYMLYCDGTEEPGLVVSLNVESKLCAGQKMFCSAWINNVTKNYSSKAELPKFRFLVEGKMANSTTWNAVTEFLSGDLEWKSGWCQVVFPIDLRYEYDEYRIRIYNFANTSNGNDFAIDDIRIYATPLSVTAYQTSTSCSPSDGYSGVDVSALIRLDYLGLMDESFFDRDIYYQVYDLTDDKALDGSYMGGRIDYGRFHLPVKGYNHKSKDGSNCYTSLQKFAAAHSANPSKKYGWVWEHIKDEERYVLYIAVDIDPDALPAWKSSDDIEMRIATSPEDFGYLTCAMSASLPLKDKLEIYVNDAKQRPSYCPNLRYKLEMHIYDYNVDDATIVDAEGRCLNDWLIISSDFTYDSDERIGQKLVGGKDLFAEEHYGYSYLQVVQAIQDMRRESTPEVPNANATATSIVELVPEDFLNPENWTIISTLIRNGMLILGKRYINAYLPESGLDFMVFPLETTGKEINPLTGEYLSPAKSMNLCFSPQRLIMNTWESQLKFHIGKKPFDKWTLAERINPYLQRVSKVRLTVNDSTLNVPLHDYKYVDIVKAELESSDDPEFNPATHWYGLRADKRYPTGYDAGGDVIKFQKELTPPAGKTRYTKFKSGKQYTFCITWRDRDIDQNIFLPSSSVTPEHGPAGNCQPGMSFVSFCVVPDTMVWTPAPNMGESWFEDLNWSEAHKTTGAAIGAGFIPLAETHVIIPKNEDERYPQIDPDGDLEKVPEAKKILLLDSAMIFGQDLLSYDTAFVDMSVPSAQWTIISPALQGTFSGDMYIPNDVAHDNVLFAPKRLDDNRSAFPFWQSFYNTQVVQENFNPLNNITLYNSAWGPFANTLTAEYLPGTGYAILGFDDTNEEGNTLLIRLPKRETQYDYFIRPTPGAPAEPSGRKADIDRADRGKFAYTPGTMTITNHEPGKLFVFGNPTMALINMKKFLAANTHLKPIFYYMDGGALSVYSEITSVSDDEHLLPPMRGVIVQLNDAEPDATTLSVTLDNSMLATTNDEERPVLYAPHRLKSNADRQLLYITAQNGSNYSSVVIGEMKGAENGYGEEDALLLTAGAGTTFKSTAFNTTINLYSACGKEALSIDFRDKMTVVPLGLYFPNLKERKDKTDLVFNGVESWGRQLFLYDVDTDTETEIFDGLVLTVETPENEELRYYIMAGKADNQHSDITTDVEVNEEIQTNDVVIDFVTLSKGQLIVVGSENIDNVQVFDATGKLVANVNGGSKILTVNLPQGVYVAKAQSGLTTKNACVIIK